MTDERMKKKILFDDGLYSDHSRPYRNVIDRYDTDTSSFTPELRTHRAAHIVHLFCSTRPNTHALFIILQSTRITTRATEDQV
jgi:hypothetical protein